VEGDRGHWLLKWDPVEQTVTHIVERHEPKVPAEAIEMLFEHREACQHARHLDLRFRFEILDDAVIADDKRPIGSARPCESAVMRLGESGCDRRFDMTPEPTSFKRHG